MQLLLCALLMLTTASLYCAHDTYVDWTTMQSSENTYASDDNFLYWLETSLTLGDSPSLPIIAPAQSASCTCESNNSESMTTKTYNMLNDAIRSLEGNVSGDQLNRLLSSYEKDHNAGNTLFHTLMSHEYDAKTFICALSLTDPHKTGELLNKLNSSRRTVFQELITEGIFLPCNTTEQQIRHHIAQTYIKATLILHIAPPALSACIYHKNTDQLCVCNATIDQLLEPAPFLPDYAQEILSYIRNEHLMLKNRAVSVST